MTRLFERSAWVRPHGARYDIDCYYDRALRFRPDDVVARMLFADYLGKRGKRDQALAQLERARADAGDNGFTHFNIGLVYLELKQFDLARLQSYRAQELGFIRGELTQKLKAANQWVEKPKDSAQISSAASAASVSTNAPESSAP